MFETDDLNRPVTTPETDGVIGPTTPPDSPGSEAPPAPDLAVPLTVFERLQAPEVRGPLYRHIKVILRRNGLARGNRRDADVEESTVVSILHDASIAIIENGFEFQNNYVFLAYLKTTTERIIFKKMKKFGRFRPLPEGDFPDPKPVEKSPHDEEQLGICLDQLPAKERELVRLRAEGVSYQDIAVRLEMTSGSLRNLHRQVLKKLRKCMGDQEPSPGP